MAGLRSIAIKSLRPFMMSDRTSLFFCPSDLRRSLNVVSKRQAELKSQCSKGVVEILSRNVLKFRSYGFLSIRVSEGCTVCAQTSSKGHVITCWSNVVMDQSIKSPSI